MSGSEDANRRSCDLGRSSGETIACQVARLIAEDFYGDRLGRDFRDGIGQRGRRTCRAGESAAWRSMPEVEATRVIRTLGADDRRVRCFLTLISAMDRARDADQLWRAGTELFLERRDLFDPACVSTCGFDELRTLLRGGGVSRRHRPDTEAWLRIAASLAASGPSSPVRRVIEEGRGDAEELRRDLRTRDEEGRTRFPMLRGPKLGPMWVRIMANPGGAVIERIENIPVAVDVQVRRATENLGVADTCGLPLRKAKPFIHQAWEEAVSAAEIGGPSGIAGTCAALDPALWFFGRHGCAHCENAGEKTPFGRACDHCVRFP